MRFKIQISVPLLIALALAPWLLLYLFVRNYTGLTVFYGFALWVTLLGSCFGNVFWLIPKYIVEKKDWLSFVVMSTLLMIVLTIAEFILEFTFRQEPVFIDGNPPGTNIELILLFLGMIFFKSVVALPISFLFHFTYNLIGQKKTTNFAELSVHILIVGMMYMLYMTFPPRWAPELDPYHFLFKAIYTVEIIALQLSFFYLNVFWLIPKFLGRQKYIVYVLLLSGLFLLSMGIEYAIYHLPLFTQAQTDMLDQAMRRDLFIKIFILLISFLYKFTKDWFIITASKNQLEAEKLSAQLDLMKFQIHPHFLFNTLNNIYALALIENGQRTAQSVEKLGSMMRHMLEECQHPYVTITKEVEYLKQYFDLQQLRMEARHVLSLHIDIPVESSELKISPMLLIPFVENAFKHGVSTRQQSFIDIKIRVSGNDLALDVSNTIHDGASSSAGVRFGLQNVKRRLESLYHGRHTLAITERDGIFRTLLTLTLEPDEMYRH